MRSKAKTSIVEKPAARGAYLGGDSPGVSGGQRRPKTVAFVGDREQRRLEREGEVVADNARLRRTVGELERRLKRLARVARRAHDAAESKFADERAARLDAEAACERLRAALEEAGMGTEEVGTTFGRSLVEELETPRSTCRDVLLVARCAARVNAADPHAVVAALPALAALAGERQGDVAHVLADNGVAASAAAAMEAHARDASVAKAGCELIATLARGGGPSVLRGLAGSARKAAGAVARDFTGAVARDGGAAAKVEAAGGERARARKLRGVEIGGDATPLLSRTRPSPSSTRFVGTRTTPRRAPAAADAAWAAAHHGGVAVANRLIADGVVAALARAMSLHPADHEIVSKGRTPCVAWRRRPPPTRRRRRRRGGGGGGCGDEGRRPGRDRGVPDDGAVDRGAGSGSVVSRGRRGRRIVARGVRAGFDRDDRGEGAEEG